MNKQNNNRMEKIFDANDVEVDKGDDDVFEAEGEEDEEYEELIVEEEEEEETEDEEDKSDSESEYSVKETGSEEEDEDSVDSNAAGPYKGVEPRLPARVEEVPTKIQAKPEQNNNVAKISQPIEKKHAPPEKPKAATTKATASKDAIKTVAKVMPKPSKLPNGSSATADPEAVAINANKAKRPTTNKMVEEAIQSLNERSGSSLIAIKKFILAHYPDLDESRINFFIKKSLKSMVSKELLVQTKGVGATGSFKLSAKVAKEKVKDNKMKQRELKAKGKAEVKQKALKQLAKVEKQKTTIVKIASKGGKMPNKIENVKILTTSKAISTKSAKDKKAQKAKAAGKTVKAAKTKAGKVPTVKKLGKSTGSLVKQPAALPKAEKKAAKAEKAAVAAKQQNAKKPMANGGADATTGAAGKAPATTVASKKPSAPAKARPKKNA